MKLKQILFFAIFAYHAATMVAESRQMEQKAQEEITITLKKKTLYIAALVSAVITAVLYAISTRQHNSLIRRMSELNTDLETLRANSEANSVADAKLVDLATQSCEMIKSLVEENSRLKDELQNKNSWQNVLRRYICLDMYVSQ